MTSEIKPVTSWLVCCRVVNGQGVLRFGIQGLTLWGNCWIVFILGSEVRMENGRSELQG